MSLFHHYAEHYTNIDKFQSKILIAMIITIMIIIIMNKTDNWDNNYFKIVTIATDVLIASV